eukprot:TRINITY_DN57726_c1_g1_i1.p2 TRINITY_DN57726_c1_g1~~TRINITY_DN57726_c1_g1_i1.p2  ORF type:complete len:284 (+),score=64.37 TRINITY_DN57726_c1_g1_i1:33-884(+)
MSEVEKKKKKLKKKKTTTPTTNETSTNPPPPPVQQTTPLTAKEEKKRKRAEIKAQIAALEASLQNEKPAEETTKPKKKKKKKATTDTPTTTPTAGFNDWTRAGFEGDDKRKDKFLKLMGTTHAKKETTQGAVAQHTTQLSSAAVIAPSTPQPTSTGEPKQASTPAENGAAESQPKMIGGLNGAPLFVAPITEAGQYSTTAPGVKRKITVYMPGQKVEAAAESVVDDEKQAQILAELTKQHNVARKGNWGRGIGFGQVELPTHELFSKNAETGKNKKITFDDDE